jgi:hypothetical protein
MKRIYHLILMVFVFVIFPSHASPSKRLIIQFSHELSAQEQLQFREKLDQLVLADHRTISQGNRWILSLSPETSTETLTRIRSEITALEDVSFVEEDKLMKAISPPVKHTQ